MRYDGSCHCGAVRFAFESAPLTTACRCNCSLCARRGALMSDTYLPFVSLEGRDALRLYIWGDRMMNHYFCGTCGVFPFSDVIERPGLYRVNLGCVDGVDLASLRVRDIDGRSF